MEEKDYVPEIDPASLQTAMKPAVEPEDKAKELNPEEMLANLPSGLQELIQDKIAQADAEGYLRGRNEVIAETQPFDNDPEPSPPIPIYNRRSIWDI